MRPRKIVGVDIDPALISYAQKNIRHYCPTEKKFPESFASLYGPLRAPYVNTGQKSSGGKNFPENVVFIQGTFTYQMTSLSVLINYSKCVKNTVILVI